MYIFIIGLHTSHEITCCSHLSIKEFISRINEPFRTDIKSDIAHISISLTIWDATSLNISFVLKLKKIKYRKFLSSESQKYWSLLISKPT